MATTLSSPGVEVREIDASVRVTTNGGTTVFIPGFASQGPVEEVTSISSITDFEQIFGVPTNAAERYFYYTVLAVLNNSSSTTTILVSRLPYGVGEGDTVSDAYTILAYPAISYTADTVISYKKDSNGNASNVVDDSAAPTKTYTSLGKFKPDSPDTYKTTIDASGDAVKVTEKNATYLIGAPTSFQMSLAEYYELLTDVLFKSNGWSNSTGKIEKWDDLRNAAFIVVNKSRSIVNESLEGFYFGINDNIFNEPKVLNGSAKEYDTIKAVKVSTKNDKDTHSLCKANEYQIISENKLDFELQGSNQGSISRVIQKDTSSYTTDDGDLDDVLSCALLKLTKSTTSTTALKLVYDLKETYNFSLGEERVNSSHTSTSPISLYAPNVTKNSNNIVVTVNPNLAEFIKPDNEGNIRGRIRVYNDKLIDNLSDVDSGWKDIAEGSTADYHNVDIIKRAGIDSTTVKAVTNLEKCDALYSFGTYRLTKNSNQFIGSVPHKVSRALDLISNDEEYPDIDIVCESGLGTIYAYASADTDTIISGKDNVIEMWLNDDGTYTEVDYGAGDSKPSTGEFATRNFVDSLVLQGVEDLRTGKSNVNDNASAVKQYYMAVQNAFLTIANSFANGGRGDVFYVSDILRGILIKGVDTKVENLYGSKLVNSVYSEEESVNHSWSTSIYYPIKHLYDGFTSSFAAVYATMFKIEDYFSNKFVWVPASGYVAAAMAAADTISGPWLAAAGLNRGVVQGVLDVAVNPIIRQRDDLYKISINSIPKITNVGAVIYGIRTMIKKASAFDQITCRRTGLLMGKTMKKYLRYYVFEQNTAYTRLSMFNDLQPYLESVKAAGGIYAYRLATDESVNTPEIINNGEMAVACAYQPVRTAEFVTLTMTAEKYTSTVYVSEG